MSTRSSRLTKAAACEAAVPLIEYAAREGSNLEAEKIACPIRIVWGTADKILAWPATAARFRDDWQLDVPLETAQLILGFTST